MARVKGEDLDRAIGAMLWMRNIHVEWIDYLTKYPGHPTDQVGNIGHHVGCVIEYDNVLNILRTAQEDTNGNRI
jgi:hypothetical protein